MLIKKALAIAIYMSCKSSPLDPLLKKDVISNRAAALIILDMDFSGAHTCEIVDIDARSQKDIISKKTAIRIVI